MTLRAARGKGTRYFRPPAYQSIARVPRPLSRARESAARAAAEPAIVKPIPTENAQNPFPPRGAEALHFPGQPFCPANERIYAALRALLSLLNDSRLANESRAGVLEKR